jgi:hypothetical protein
MIRAFTRAWHALLLVISFCVAFSGAAAQENGPRQGSLIRFRVPPQDSLHVADLARITADSLVLERCETCSRLLFSRAEVNHLEVFVTTNRGDRLIAGFGIGGLIGGGLGYLSARTCKGNADACELSFLAVPFGAIAGAILGAGVGFITAYKWEPVTSDAPLQSP